MLLSITFSQLLHPSFLHVYLSIQSSVILPSTLTLTSLTSLYITLSHSLLLLFFYSHPTSLSYLGHLPLFTVSLFSSAHYNNPFHPSVFSPLLPSTPSFPPPFLSLFSSVVRFHFIQSPFFHAFFPLFVPWNLVSLTLFCSFSLCPLHSRSPSTLCT